jgi:protein-S-isoprenylcysteine O-methyltransferase Ste14
MGGAERMELIREFGIGWLNGWILLAAMYTVLGIMRLTFPRETVRKLWDRSGRSKRQRVNAGIASVLSLGCAVLVAFTPLKVGEPVFISGIILFILSLTGLVIAFFNFKNTPLNQPVTSGIYRVSRNPQQVMLLTAFIGMTLAVGSWIALIITVISSVFYHGRILSEEQACLEKYGNSYLEYTKRIPRYFLFV